VAFEAIKDDKTINVPTQNFELHLNQITTWKSELFEVAELIF